MKTRIFILLLATLAFSCKKSDSGTDADNYPTDGLVSYFNFNDNLTDVQGVTPDGVNTNGAPFVSGKRGKAISFDGAGQKVTFGKESFKSGNSVSVAFWFLKSDSTDIQPMVACRDFVAFTTTSGIASCGMVMALAPNEFVYGNFTLGQWTHYAATYDGTDMKIYVNGVLKQTVTHPATLGAIGFQLSLGYHDTIYFKGSIDDLFLYSKALTQEEVGLLYGL